MDVEKDGAEEPRHYLAQFVDQPVKITGRMDDPAWERARWSEDFVDILGARGPTPKFRTRFKILWDPCGLTIGAQMEEPHVWATLTERESVIFRDNDFEVFLDPDGDGALYGELEINALNTTWDLLLTQPYFTHGAALTGWDLHGLRTAVSVDGTLNDPSDEDRGWTVEIVIPWAAIGELARGELPPAEGDVWRVNFSRVEWEHEIVEGEYRTIPGRPEMNWVWSPQGIVDMHRPRRWGVVEFTRTGERRFAGLPPEHSVLDRAFEAQARFQKERGRWARNIDELGVCLPPDLRIETTSSLLELSLGQWRIDHTSRLWRA
jgi:hypothetical protein